MVLTKLLLTIAKVALHTDAVYLSFCPFVCRQNAYTKTWFSQKLSSLELWPVLMTNSKSYMGFSKNPLWTPKMSAILKIVISPYLNKKSFSYNEIWYTITDL